MVFVDGEIMILIQGTRLAARGGLGTAVLSESCSNPCCDVGLPGVMNVNKL